MSSSNANFKVFETMIVKKNCITPVLHLNMLIWPLWQFCTFIKLHPILMKYYFNNVIFKWHPLFTDLNKILYMSLFHQKCVSAFCRKFSRYKNVFNITKMCFFGTKCPKKIPVFLDFGLKSRRPKSKFRLQRYLRNPYLHGFWKFQTNSLKNVGGVGILVIDTWPKWRFEIWPFLWFFGGQHGQFGSSWVCPSILM